MKSEDASIFTIAYITKFKLQIIKTPEQSSDLQLKTNRGSRLDDHLREATVTLTLRGYKR